MLFSMKVFGNYRRRGKGKEMDRSVFSINICMISELMISIFSILANFSKRVLYFSIDLSFAVFVLA